jgi:Family of unknown function (DUF6062)
MRDKDQSPPFLADQDIKDIRRDLRTRRCPVCNHLIQTSIDYFSQWINPFSQDEQIQEAFAVELGLCPFHTWQLASFASPQGISQGYPKLLKRISGELAELTRTLTNLPDRVFALIKDSQSCRLCSLLRDTEAAYIQRLALFLEEAQGRPAYANSQGVCLRHLGLLTEKVSSDETVRFLLAEAARHFDQIAVDLQSYSEKRKVLRRDLITSDEADAYLRALTHIAGNKNNPSL